MTEDDMYALIQFLQDKEDEMRARELQCLDENYAAGASRYGGMKDAYRVVLGKIFAQRINQRPHISKTDWEW